MKKVIVKRPVQADSYVPSYKGNADDVKSLKRALQKAWDILEGMDDETYQVVQGESIIEDLDIHIRTCAEAVTWINGGDI